MTPLYLSLDAEGRVNGYGDDPAIFERAIEAPEGFDLADLDRALWQDGQLRILGRTPERVAARQLRLALLEAGHLDEVEAAFHANMPRAIQIEWEYATEIPRLGPLAGYLADLLELEREAIDQLFIDAERR